jgi:hypothetical protein
MQQSLNCYLLPYEFGFSFGLVALLFGAPLPAGNGPYRIHHQRGVSYLLELEKRENPLVVIENLVNVFPVFKDEIMSAARQLRQEAIKGRNLKIARGMRASS